MKLMYGLFPSHRKRFLIVTSLSCLINSLCLYLLKVHFSCPTVSYVLCLFDKLIFYKSTPCCLYSVIRLTAVVVPGEMLFFVPEVYIFGPKSPCVQGTFLWLHTEVRQTKINPCNSRREKPKEILWEHEEGGATLKLALRFRFFSTKPIMMRIKVKGSVCLSAA